MSRLAILFIVATSLHAETQVKFSRTCRVLRVANDQSPPACEMEQGTVVDKYKVTGPAFVEVVVGLCKGFVPRNCLVVVRQTIEKNVKDGASEKKIYTAPVVYTAPPPKSTQLMLFGNVDGILGSTTGAATSAKGRVLGLGLGGRTNMGKRFRLLAGPSYQSMSIGRTSEASANSVIYDQYYKYLGVLAQVQMALDPSAVEHGGGFSYWIDGGLQYLHPLSGTQQTSFASETSFTAPRVLLALVGLAGELPFSNSRMGLSVSLDFYYNLLAATGTKLMGGRVLLALTYGL